MAEERTESGRRVFSGLGGKILRWVTVIFALYSMLYVAGVFQYMGIFIFPRRHDAIFLMFVLVFTFTYFPATKRSSKNRVPWYDIIAILGAIAANIYIVLYALDISARPYQPPTMTEQVFGIIIVVLIIEGVRRTAGLALSIIGTIFFVYPFVAQWMPAFLSGRNQTLPRIVEMMYVYPSGIYSTTLHLLAVLVVVFLVFGAFLSVSGAGKFIIDLSYSLMGRFRGGPAKVAVVASGLFGSINGSGSANVAATGVITIPLMKQLGYKPHYAAAVEAVASNGGQIMPPVLGLTAFLIMDFIGVSYVEVVVAAIIPALLYYAALFIMIDLEAVKTGIKGMAKSELPSFRRTMREGWPYLAPLGLLVVMLGLQYSAQTACLYAIAALIATPWLKRLFETGWAMVQSARGNAVAPIPPLGAEPETAPEPLPETPEPPLTIARTNAVAWVRQDLRASVRNTVNALDQGMQVIPSIGVIICMAGILLGVLQLTGVGVRMTGGLVAIAGNSMFLLLLLTAFCAMILGMGMPGVAVYVLCAILLAPALVQAGMEPIVAHFFVFYYGLTSMLTPPVCLIAFIAAGIAGAPYMKTGWQAMRLGIVVFLVPFMFAYGPELLLIGQPGNIAITVTTAFIGVVLLSAGIEGYLLRFLSWPERILFLVGGVLMMIPINLYTYIGFGIGVALVVYQIIRGRQGARPPDATAA